MRSMINALLGYKSSIRKSLLLFFVLFALIPTIIITFIYSYFSTSYISKVTMELGVLMIDRVGSELESFFSTITRVGDIAAGNQRIQESLRVHYHDNIGDRYSKDIENDSELYFANYLQPEILGLNVLGDNGNEFKSHNRTFINQDHTKRYWYRKIRENDGYVWFPPHIGQYANISAGETVISCGRPVVDKATGAVTGVVLIDVREDVLRDIVSTQLGGSGYILILDERDNVIYSPFGLTGSLVNLSEIRGKNHRETMVTSIRMEGSSFPLEEKFITAFREIPQMGWKLMGVIPVRSVNRWNNFLTVLISLVFLVIISMAFYAAVSLSNKVTSPIRKLSLAMKQIEKGDLNVSLPEEGYEEVVELTESFNRMISEIQLLLQKIYEEHGKLRKAELKTLQAQINPHFLYNTLDSILWLNRDGMKDEVQTLVESLTAFFRIGISRGKDIITLREELEHVENYLKIQSIRYADKFDYSIEVDENLLDYRIPKLVLQPLVENAIYHGVKLVHRKGHIGITAETRNDTWKIFVTDTGKGMTPQTLEQLNCYLKGKTDVELNIFGVGNVNERLQIICGADAGLVYESEEERGTTVAVTLSRIERFREE